MTFDVNENTKKFAKMVIYEGKILHWKVKFKKKWNIIGRIYKMLQLRFQYFYTELDYPWPVGSN